MAFGRTVILALLLSSHAAAVFGQENGGAQVPPAAERGLDHPVRFTARDSLVIVFPESGEDVGSLYGEAGIVYGESELRAHRLDIFFEADELRATGLRSDTGWVGRPQFTQRDETFSGDELAFNMRTERGRVVGAQSSMQDGFIRAGVVKMADENTIYVADGAYTTCECVDDPSYTLRSSRMKVVDQEWIYTGPIQLYLFNIPTPIWLPFGFLPAAEGRRSGPLPPRYGEDERGFYLRGWGWYQAINDYLDAQLQFGLWTRGSWQITPQLRYARRYHYRGQLDVDYVRNRRGERDDPDFAEISTSSLRWNHQQELSPTSSFNANVNLSSQNYLRTISEQYDDRVRQSVQSSVRYSTSWPNAGRNLSVNLNHRQVLATGSVSATLPNVRFSQNARTPFRRSGPGAEQWYERITYSYSSSLDNRYTFNPLPADTLAARGDDGIAWYEGMFYPSRYRRATGQDEPFEFRASHEIRSSANFSVTRIPIINRQLRLTLSPNVNYSEDWVLRTERRFLDESTGQIERESRPGFLALRQFSTGVSSNTTFYGIFPIRIGPYDGLRHTVHSSLGFTYRPDFFDDFWGYTDTYVDQRGETVRYPVVSGVQRGRQQALTLNVGNVFETRRVVESDNGERQTRPQQLLNLDANTAYNFAADSMRLAPVRLSARTRILDQFDLRAGTTLSPYAIGVTGREVNRYLFSDNVFNPFRVTQFNVSFNTSLRSRASGPERPFAAPTSMGAGAPFPVAGQPLIDPTDPFQAQSIRTPAGYADFAIPWSLNLTFNYNYSKPFLQANRSATVNATFDFNLTPNWKVQGRSGYDFVQGDVVLTNLAILRDFECWEMGISWIPFGPYQSYSFDLRVKSGHLRDILRLRQPQSDVRGQLGRLLD